MSGLNLKILKMATGLIAALVFCCLGISFIAKAASIQKCTESTRRCVIQLEDGIVGDRVRVLNERAYVVAEGRVLKRKGPYGVISISNITQSIRRGYPVIVDIENRNSNLQWAATFSDKE